MTVRDLLVDVALVAFGLAALALAFAVRAVVRRARARQPQRWVGLFFRGVLIAGLVALGTVSLLNAPPPELVNRPSPAAADATVAFLPLSYSQPTNVVEGVSARDGSHRWTRTVSLRLMRLMVGPEGVAYALGIASAPPAGVSPYALYALRLSDGVTLWSRTGLSYEDVAPVWDSAHVYVTLAGVNNARTVAALDAATGAPVWQTPVPADAQGSTQIAVSGGMIALVGFDPQPARWRLLALRAADGAAAWTVTGDATPGVTGSFWAPRVAATPDTIFTLPYAGPVMAFDSQTGARLWAGDTYAAPGDFLATLAATTTASTLYTATQPQSASQGVPSQYHATLAARDARTGRILWSRYLTTGASALVAHGGALLVSDYFGYQIAVDLATGEPHWRIAGFLPGSAPLETAFSQGAGGQVYLQRFERDQRLSHQFCLFCPSNAWLYAINPRNGDAWWRVQVGTVQTAHFTL